MVLDPTKSANPCVVAALKRKTASCLSIAAPDL